MELLMLGKSSKEIAKLQYRGNDAVKHHRLALRRKIGNVPEIIKFFKG